MKALGGVFKKIIVNIGLGHNELNLIKEAGLFEEYQKELSQLGIRFLRKSKEEIEHKAIKKMAEVINKK
jgi:hypothetical protein